MTTDSTVLSTYRKVEEQWRVLLAPLAPRFAPTTCDGVVALCVEVRLVIAAAHRRETTSVVRELGVMPVEGALPG